MNENIIAHKTCPRGIPQSKKDDIVKKLCPMMEMRNRRIFRENLAVVFKIVVPFIKNPILNSSTSFVLNLRELILQFCNLFSDSQF